MIKLHGNLKKGVEFRFIKGRLKFEGSNNTAPFRTMIVVLENYDLEHEQLSLF